MDLNWIVSVDDHLFEAPDTWTKAAPAALRDRVPRVVKDDGVDYWAFEDVRSPVYGVLVQAGRDKATITPEPVAYDEPEMLAAYYDPTARLEYMDRDGVLASMCFPFFPRFCGQTFSEAKDRELGWWCLQRYNDWVIDEWAGASGGRLIPLTIIPLWDPQLAVKEIERCADKGSKAISFSENPSKLGLPSLHQAEYWDPVFAAAAAADLPLAMHFGSSSSVPTTSEDAPLLVSGALAPVSLAFAFTDWIFCGALERFPDLKIMMSEGGIGWIPYMIQRCETIIRTQEWTRRMDFRYDLGSGKGGDTGRGGITLSRSPRELFHDQIYGCFIDDVFGCDHLDEIGFDNVMIETDFPHGDSSYPHSIKGAHEQLAKYDEDVKYKIMRGNAEKLFGLDLSTPSPIPR